MLQPSTFGLYSLLLGQDPTMDHRAYKTQHMPLTVPDGFTVEQVGDNPTTPANPQGYTEVMIPLTMEQYKFITTTATSQPGGIRVT